MHAAGRAWLPVTRRIYGRKDSSVAAVHANTMSQGRKDASGQLLHEQQLITSTFLQLDRPLDVQLHVIILNYDLPDAALKIWSRATTRVCADGGANRLHDAHLAASSSSASAQQQQQPHAAPAGGARTAGANNGSQALPQASGRGPALPTVVVGDLDSLRPDVRAHYEQLGVPVVDLSADQDSTDLTKCVRWIEQHAMADAAPSGRCGSSGGVNATSTSTSSSTSSRDGGGQQDAPAGTGRHVILALGALGGRLDHTLGNLNTLHLFPHLDITLWGQGNLARLVRPGRAAIRPAAGLEGPFCGLAPLAQPATASSRGLRWNLAATRMAFGGLISTSNRLEAGEVWVETDQPLVWTTQVDDAAV